MPYSHLLVAVAPTPESRILVDKAVSIARPVQAKISLITFTADPEMYNQLAAPMMENLRELMQEETKEFLAELIQHMDYPVEETVIASGELGEHVRHFCQKKKVDLVLCGNHNKSFFSRATCSAKTVVGNSGVDVLLISLEKAQAK
ncbi:universal stress protein UspC [Trabulsiella odontotermitis]|uniref:universal stress protein UspC n=1 Tax=Trabulsiella odontotermitis TaxID=379893 RepID=UPI0024B6A771|nr:universal stress protein UspC [Trabulsiella odontotermitis]WHP29750.1 universal stress protein UspC [Trabulsiella odontotermitis]